MFPEVIEAAWELLPELFDGGTEATEGAGEDAEKILGGEAAGEAAGEEAGEEAAAKKWGGWAGKALVGYELGKDLLGVAGNAVKSTIWAADTLSGASDQYKANLAADLQPESTKQQLDYLNGTWAYAKYNTPSVQDMLKTKPWDTTAELWKMLSPDTAAKSAEFAKNTTMHSLIGQKAQDTGNYDFISKDLSDAWGGRSCISDGLRHSWVAY